MSYNSPQHDSEKTQCFSDKEKITKNKGKRVTKLNKVKINEIVSKSYILGLENQEKMLKSTIELQSKVKTSTQSEIPLNHNIIHPLGRQQISTHHQMTADVHVVIH